MRSRTVTIGGTDYTADTIAEISINKGRTTLNDPVAPTTCSGAFRSDAISNITLGTTIVVTVGTGSYAQRFSGWITSLEADRYVTRFVAIDDRLGYFARRKFGAYTIPATITYASGTRTPQLYYVIVHRLYVAGLMTEANYDLAMGRPIPWTLPSYSVPLTLGYSVSIDLDGTLLQAGAVLPAGTALDQLNTLVANKPQGTFTGSSFDLTRTWSTVYDYAPPLNKVDVNYVAELNTDNLLNKVTATYGTSSSVTLSDPVSANTYGASELEATTTLGDYAGAMAYAYRLLASRRTPRWLTNPIRFNVDALTTAEYTAGDWTPYTGRAWDLSAIQTEIPYLPKYAFVEGFTETITANSHLLDVYAFDAIFTNEYEAWSDVTASVRWSTVDPTLTWYDMIGAIV